MSLRRRTPTTPLTAWNLPKLDAQARAQWPQLVAVNDVDGQPALYFDNDAGTVPTQATADSFFAAHDPTPLPPSDDDQAQTALTGARAKAQAVLDGTDTFTAAQVQQILARLVLRATR